MDYYGLLFLYYLKGLSGKSILRLFFNIEVGGTEQLLPENTSTPTTTPILADIQYPDGLRTDQYFTYRETPTTVSNKARIKTIKGQTLKWNQLASIVGEQTSTVGLFDANTHVYSGHKYLMTVEATPTSSNPMYISIYYNNGSNRQYRQITGTTSGKYTMVFNCNYTASGGASNVLDHFWFYVYNASSWKNLMLFDLTAMGLDSLTDEEILQWFADYYPLPYYAYNAGTLLSFNGTGIKTANEDESEEHTTTLPISTYFPTGMKSVGTVYDELTPSKATTRVGSADLGSLEWTSANTSTQGISRMRTSSLGNVILKPADVSIKANVVCVNYETLTANSTYIKNTGISVDGGGDILVYDPNYNTSESVASFKQAMSGKYLYYELATYTETPITTEDANEALSLLMGKSVSSDNANQLINIITKGE